MTTALPRLSATVMLAKASLQRVFDNLQEDGFTLVGPTVRDGAVVLDEIRNMADLPAGYRDEQQPGRYRLARSIRHNYFDCTMGPHAWKRFLFPPRLKLLAVERSNGRWKVQPNDDAVPRYALIGVRPCDLHAIAIQDRVFLGGEHRDSHYAKRRHDAFVLGVNCTRSHTTCFCTSLKTGPRLASGFDLGLTELQEGFVIEVGSEAGAAALEGSQWEPATAFDLGRASHGVQTAERHIRNHFPTDDLPRLLYDNIEHTFWDELDSRCLACGNCTMVCPTCFCSTVEDTSDLAGATAERTRVWDSCFNKEFSHVHGGNIRPTIRSRYRQWITHKFASWVDQFGTFGCVGCGRCATWCPAGIQITEEIKKLRNAVQK